VTAPAAGEPSPLDAGATGSEGYEAATRWLDAAGSPSQVSGALVPDTVTTRGERDLAVMHWLLATAIDRTEARAGWNESGCATLLCGALFSAVRIPAGLVHAAAGTADPDEVDAYLACALLAGPVFLSLSHLDYYVLVPTSTARHWDLPDTECLGKDRWLGVPRPGLMRRDSAALSAWCVPMDSPGELAPASAVSQLIMTGRYRKAVDGVVC